MIIVGSNFVDNSSKILGCSAHIPIIELLSLAILGKEYKLTLLQNTNIKLILNYILQYINFTYNC